MATERQEPAPGETVPPLYLEEATEGQLDTSTVWYLDSEHWRETLSTDGSFRVRSGNDYGECLVGEMYCFEDLVDGGGISGVDIPHALYQPTRDLVAQHCDGPTTETILGRTAGRYTCTGTAFEWSDGNTWVAYADPGWGTHEWWFDDETGLVLREVTPWSVVEVTSLVLNPAFPAGIFDYEAIGFELPLEAGIGDPAPLFSGEYLDGTPFRLEDLRGTPLAVFDWCPTCGPINMEGLADFQELYERHGSSVQFLVASEERVSETRRLIERHEITVPTVSCFLDNSNPVTGSNRRARR